MKGSKIYIEETCDIFPYTYLRNASRESRLKSRRNRILQRYVEF